MKRFSKIIDYGNRKSIYDRAKLFGCNEVVICSDQGPTELMCELMNIIADVLVAYTKSRKYIHR